MTWLRFSEKRGRISKDPLQEPDALARLLDELSRRWNTPDLIAYAADEQTRLLLLKALVSPASEADRKLARRAGEILRRRGRDPQKLRERLEPAAYALGMVSACDVPLDHYELLGVSPSATPQEIRAAYRKKAFERHPDTARARGGDPADFVQLQAAYDTLMNPQNRAAYDGCRNHLGMWREEGRRNRAAAEDQGMPGRARWIGYRVTAIVGVLIIAAWVTSIAFEEWAMVETVQEAPPHAPQMDAQNQSGEPAGVSIAKRPSALAEPGTPEASPVSDDEAAPDNRAPELGEARAVSVPLVPGHQKQQEAQPTKAAPVSEPKKGKEQSKQPVSASATVRAPAKQTKRPEVKIEVHQKDAPKKPPKTKPVQVAPIKKHAPVNRSVSQKAVADAQEVQPSEMAESSQKSVSQEMEAKPAPAPETPPARETASPERTDPPVRIDLGSKYDEWLATRTAQMKRAERAQPVKPMPPKPAEAPPLSVDRAQVLAFLKRYTRAYEAGAAETFFSLFTADATENGTPLEVIKPQYRNLWNRMKSLNYVIELNGVEQEPERSGLKVEGRFTLWWDAVDQSWGQSQGDIYLTLHAGPDGLRVRQLRYRFD